MSASVMLGECCDAIKMVLSRRREADRVGLMIETLFSLRGGPTREVIVVRCHKSKDRKDPFADATYCVVQFCPFCGAEQPSTAVPETTDEPDEVANG